MSETNALIMMCCFQRSSCGKKSFCDWYIVFCRLSKCPLLANRRKVSRVYHHRLSPLDRSCLSQIFTCRHFWQTMLAAVAALAGFCTKSSRLSNTEENNFCRRPLSLAQVWHMSDEPWHIAVPHEHCQTQVYSWPSFVSPSQSPFWGSLLQLPLLVLCFSCSPQWPILEIVYF